MATHSSILAWRNPWTEEPDWLQSMGLREFDTKERLNTNMHASGVLSEVIWHPLFLCLGISIPPIELVYQSKIANEIFWLSQCAVFELKSSRCHHGVMTALFFFFFSFLSLIAASPSDSLILPRTLAHSESRMTKPVFVPRWASFFKALTGFLYGATALCEDSPPPLL